MVDVLHKYQKDFLIYVVDSVYTDTRRIILLLWFSFFTQISDECIIAVFNLF